MHPDGSQLQTRGGNRPSPPPPEAKDAWLWPALPEVHSEKAQWLDTPAELRVQGIELQLEVTHLLFKSARFYFYIY